jgi:hypothetical protein
VSRVTRALGVVVFLAAAVGLFAACKEDDAAITTPSGGGLATPTRAPSRTATPDDETGTPTAAVSDEQEATAEEIVNRLAADICAGECPDGAGEFAPADILANVPDLFVPGARPGDLDLVTGFLGPGSAGATVSSVKDATVLLIYIAEDGGAWLTLSQGPDTRTAPAEGDDVQLSDDVTATLVPDPDGDETAGSLEWADDENVLFVLDWEGVAADEAVAFGEEIVG